MKMYKKSRLNYSAKDGHIYIATNGKHRLFVPGKIVSLYNQLDSELAEAEFRATNNAIPEKLKNFKVTASFNREKRVPCMFERPETPLLDKERKESKAMGDEALELSKYHQKQEIEHKYYNLIDWVLEKDIVLYELPDDDEAGYCSEDCHRFNGGENSNLCVNPLCLTVERIAEVIDFIVESEYIKPAKVDLPEYDEPELDF